MAEIICRQPNGKICRFSTIVDTITHYNMTDAQYIEFEVTRARERAMQRLASGLTEYDDMIARFEPRNMSRAEFNAIRCFMGEVINKSKSMKK